VVCSFVSDPEILGLNLASTNLFHLFIVHCSDPAPLLGLGLDPPGAVRRRRAIVLIRCHSGSGPAQFLFLFLKITASV
jgi:hypothetical protein